MISISGSFMPRVVKAGVPMRMPLVTRGRPLVEGDGVLVDGDAGLIQGLFRLQAGEPGGSQVQQDEMGVGAARHQAVPLADKFPGQGPGVGHDLLLIAPERRPLGFLEGHCLGGDDVHEGAALDPRENLAVQAPCRIGVGPG